VGIGTIETNLHSAGNAEVVSEQHQRRERQRGGEHQLSAVAHEMKVYSLAETYGQGTEKPLNRVEAVPSGNWNAWASVMNSKW
jgi:hypothetical protein